MTEDPRIKIELKRYPKGEEWPAGSWDSMGTDWHILAAACRSESEDFLSTPCELDAYAREFLAKHLAIDFDVEAFDYFLHAYVRSEFTPNYYDDPSIKFRPSPEEGPLAALPCPPGRRWQAVRPKNGQEHFIAVQICEVCRERDATVHLSGVTATVHLSGVTSTASRRGRTARTGKVTENHYCEACFAETDAGKATAAWT